MAWQPNYPRAWAWVGVSVLGVLVATIGAQMATGVGATLVIILGIAVTVTGYAGAHLNIWGGMSRRSRGQ